jgi:hypothetical protein
MMNEILPDMTPYRMLFDASGWFMLFNTFNDISVISWRSVLLMEETGVAGEKHRPVANH